MHGELLLAADAFLAGVSGQSGGWPAAGADAPADHVRADFLRKPGDWSAFSGGAVATDTGVWYNAREAGRIPVPVYGERPRNPRRWKQGIQFGGTKHEKDCADYGRRTGGTVLA